MGAIICTIGSHAHILFPSHATAKFSLCLFPWLTLCLNYMPLKPTSLPIFGVYAWHCLYFLLARRCYTRLKSKINISSNMDLFFTMYIHIQWKRRYSQNTFSTCLCVIFLIFSSSGMGISIYHYSLHYEVAKHLSSFWFRSVIHMTNWQYDKKKMCCPTLDPAN